MRPEYERKERPNALTTPAVTVYWKPYGLPIAIASWPTRSFWESPSSATVRFGASIRTTARSVAGSSPIKDAGKWRPSGNDKAIREASCTTWLFVSTSPSGLNTNPDPPPCRSRGSPLRARPAVCVTSIFATDGLTFSAAETTAQE